DILNDLSLTTAQCQAAFPNLTWAIDDVVAQGPFTIDPKTSPVIVRIHKDNQLSILKAQRRRDLSTEMLASRTASLHQLHRALLTTPASDRPLFSSSSSSSSSSSNNNNQNDILIALNFQDQPFGSNLAYSRQADPQSRPGFDDGNPHARTFLMPHFSFWAWKLPFIGSMQRAAAAIGELESSLPFASKIPKAIWRGTAWFNSVQNPRLRQNLLGATADKPWADVEALTWDTVPGGGQAQAQGQAGERTASNSLPIEDFCRYKYVLYTEGVTYSGRFQFLQLCGSVVLSPPIAWMMHVTHLVKPAFSSDFLASSSSLSSASWTPSEMVRRSWPIHYAPHEANMVFVKPDWSDLEDVVAWLEQNPDVAQGIATRQRHVFAGGGYLSPAAEACYWRALVKGWAEVARWDEAVIEGLGRGQSYEAWAITN
ncbi:glycosyl transferase family 90-domain-containing protein, partial [Coniella lustricola]